ncbi:MAG: chaperone modulator CbpM [Saprospiraceae bacterium]
MANPDLILLEEFCTHYDIDLTFLNELIDCGLIEVTVIEFNNYLSYEHLNVVEKFIRLHYEMGINVEGIDAISNLLNQIGVLQTELMLAKKKLKVFELD